MAQEPTEGMLAARKEMITEARRIVDFARERGVPLRLFGGLAVRLHCEQAYACERDYSDIDLVGLKRQSKQIPKVFAELGFEENLHVRQATMNKQLQFYRECDHPDAARHFFIHPDDHVDVFLDTFRMEHEVPLADRLEIEDYTLSLTDILLTKLLSARLNDKDVRDVISLLGHAALGKTDARGVVNAAHIAVSCAGDWGLYHDVLTGVAQVRTALGSRDDLEAALTERVRSALDRLEDAIEQEPKSRKWRLRARVGTRRPWSNLVEEEEGDEHGRSV